MFVDVASEPACSLGQNLGPVVLIMCFGYERVTHHVHVFLIFEAK